MDTSILKLKRKNYIEIGELYFWTATINQWQRLLWKGDYKNVIINSLKYLVEKGKIDVFAFVIMPNHIHFIWRIHEMNGKEAVQGSFLKYSAHEFKKLLKNDTDNNLSNYAVEARNKKYEFWQRDPLAIQLFTRDVAYQKLDYIHANPCTEYWKLATDPCMYFHSSAKFYMEGIKNFSFLKDLRDEF